jgi:hypothetical protein
MGWKPFSHFRVFGRAMKTNARARPARWQYPYPQNPVKAHRRNPAFVNHRVEQFTPLCIRRSELAKIFAIKARI